MKTLKPPTRLNTAHSFARNLLQRGAVFGLACLMLVAKGEDAGAAGKSPEIGPASGLNDLLHFAALNNAGLKAAFHQWKAAMEKIPQVTALPDPKLNYGYFVRSVETRAGPQNHRVGIAQMFPWFGRLKLQGEKAAQEAEVAFQRLESSRQKLWFELRDAWYEHAYLHRAIEIVDENISLLKQLEGVAQSKFQGGGSYLGVVKAQVELGKLDDRKRSLADLLEPVRARLNAALSRESSAPLPEPKLIPGPALARDDQSLLDGLSASNPDLKGFEAGIAREEKGVALAKKDFYPDVTLGLDYVVTGEALVRTAPDSGKDPVVAMFSINIPLWWGKLRAGVKEAEARREAMVEQRSDFAHRLAAGLKMALYGYRDAERKISLYRDTLVPQANSALTVAQQSYEGGKADFLETVDAQRLLLEFQLQAVRSAADREKRLAEIDLLTGRGAGGWSQGIAAPETPPDDQKTFRPTPPSQTPDPKPRTPSRP